jgi:hypothetical protein
MKQQSMLERVAASFADRIHQEMNDPYPQACIMGKNKIIVPSRS